MFPGLVAVHVHVGRSGELPGVQDAHSNGKRVGGHVGDAGKRPPFMTGGEQQIGLRPRHARIAGQPVGERENSIPVLERASSRIAPGRFAERAIHDRGLAREGPPAALRPARRPSCAAGCAAWHGPSARTIQEDR